MIVTTADLYKIAYGKYAVGAYNVNNLEQILVLFRAHKNQKLGSAQELTDFRKVLAEKYH